MVKPKSNLISYSLLRNVRDWEAIVDAGAKCAGVFADAPCRVQIPARIAKQYQTKLTEVVMVALLGVPLLLDSKV